MRMWQVIILVNLALATGLSLGYGAWGRRLATRDGEIKTAQAQVEQLRREREACFAGARVGEQLWEGRGIVRAAYPKLLLITHEEIPGLLPARTTGFRLADSAAHGQVHAGDPIRFWLQGTGSDNTVLVRTETW
ncbi:MAG: copper-binding protein [Rhodopila sp.]